METYVGLDVSQKVTAICVVDRDGKSVWHGSVISNPEEIARAIRLHAPEAVRVGMETGPLERLVEQNMPPSSLVQGVLDILIDSLRHIGVQINALDQAICRVAQASPVCRRLMTVPGVGSLTAVAFASAVDNAERFSSVRDIGPYLGLTPTKYQSGNVDRNAGISKAGCRLTRHLLFEAASSLISRYRQDCDLRRWALTLIPRIGARKAMVATARKLATVLLSMWKGQTDFKAIR
ncbi:transposase [Mycetohabitans rhizoxinica]|uniref:Transposase n=1 Tax=Mycetohabitans rhizoxinica TaxID=412963 RepID=A0ABZ2PYF0_9BURK